MTLVPSPQDQDPFEGLDWLAGTFELDGCLPVYGGREDLFLGGSTDSLEQADFDQWLESLPAETAQTLPSTYNNSTASPDPLLDLHSSESESQPSKEAPSNGKSFVVQPCECDKCRTPLATLLLHGGQYPSTPIAVSCPTCLDPTTLPKPSSSRKRKPRNEASALTCEACKQTIGTLHPPAASQEKTSHEDTPVPDIEPLCLSCYHKYACCSECGGGGTFRTGKWRPKELFAPGRRTCSLSHVRVGGIRDYEYEYEVVEITSSSTSVRAELVEEIKRFYYETGMKAMASSQVMEKLVGLETWDKLSRRATAAVKEVEEFLIKPCPVDEVRYVGIVRMPCAPTRRKRFAPIEATVSKPIAGFLTAIYNNTHRTFFHSYTLFQNTTPSGPALPLLQTIVSRLPEEPRFMYILARRHKTPQTQNIARRLGFRFWTLQEMRGKVGEVREEWFAKRDEFEVLCVEWKEVRKVLEKGTAVGGIGRGREMWV